MESNNKKTRKDAEYSINKLKKNEAYFVHELTPDALGKAIREVRKKRKLTQKEFAGLMGIAESTLCKIENNTRDIRVSTIFKIIERLNAKVYFQIELQHYWKKFNAEKKRELLIKNKEQKNKK